MELDELEAASVALELFVQSNILGPPPGTHLVDQALSRVQTQPTVDEGLVRDVCADVEPPRCTLHVQLIRAVLECTWRASGHLLAQSAPTVPSVLTESSAPTAPSAPSAPLDCSVLLFVCIPLIPLFGFLVIGGYSWDSGDADSGCPPFSG